jgi:hypothetical protein
MRSRLAGASVVVALAATGFAARADAPPPPSTYFAGMHNHTGYSDGVPGTTPADAYATAQANGLDIMTTTEHSEGFDVPMTLSTQCLPNEGGTLTECALADGANSFRKWDANGEQASAASGANFLAARGFEWTSDVEDHINVYLSGKYTNAKIDGGYATMATFWKWVLDNKDALVTFNHPGDKTNQNTGGIKIAPGPFDDFRYVPDADRRVVGIEVFNGGKTKDYTNRGVNWIARALNSGWHVGLVGAQDNHTDDWGDPAQWPRTGFLMSRLTEGDFRDALLQRRFYATTDANLHLSFGTSDGALMGARLRRAAGSQVTLVANASDPDGETIQRIELFSSPDPDPNDPTGVSIRDTWKPVSSANGSSLQASVTSDYGERWYLVRVVEADGEKAYSSPVWIGADTHGYSEWLAGDLHVHTQNGHDTCLADDPTRRFDGTECGFDEMYTWGFTPGERIALAKERGLDYLAITDHNNVMSQTDHDYVTELAGEPGNGFTLIPAYENSLPGHTQMLGATHCFGGQHTTTDKPIPVTYCDNPFPQNATLADEVQVINDEMIALRAEDGIFQINHPGDAFCSTGCGKWYNRYKDVLFQMIPDAIEVWNIGPWEYQPPAEAANDNDFALAFWEMFLDHGDHVAATGGSDSHWRSTSAVQGVGQPTTWVYSGRSGWPDVLAGIREGHTFVTHQPPVYASPRIFLEADADGNGTFESVQGDTVPIRSTQQGVLGPRIRVRLENAPPGSFVRIVEHGPGFSGTGNEIYPFTGLMQTQASWIRAELLIDSATSQDARQSGCDPLVGSRTTYCRNRLMVLALTSPIYQVPA